MPRATTGYRIIADAMLGRLARWLRILGFRTVYAEPKLPDDEIIKLAMRRRAVLLTRDEALYSKAKGYVRAVLIRSNDCPTQLLEASRALGFRIPTRMPQTYCAECGCSLKRVPKTSVKGKVWPRVFARQKAFWKCRGCGKLYWRGTHVREIRGALKKLRAKSTD